MFRRRARGRRRRRCRGRRLRSGGVKAGSPRAVAEGRLGAGEPRLLVGLAHRAGVGAQRFGGAESSAPVRGSPRPAAAAERSPGTRRSRCASRARRSGRGSRAAGAARGRRLRRAARARACAGWRSRCAGSAARWAIDERSLERLDASLAVAGALVGDPEVLQRDALRPLVAEPLGGRARLLWSRIAVSKSPS